MNTFYARFIEVVDNGRAKLNAEQVRALADGRVYTGEGALANGLVDHLGTMDDAIALAKTRCGRKRVKVVMYHRAPGHRANAYSRAAVAPQMNLVNISVPGLLSVLQPQPLYLWTGRTTGAVK